MRAWERAFRFSGRLRVKTRTLAVGAEVSTRPDWVSLLLDIFFFFPFWLVEKCVEWCMM